MQYQLSETAWMNSNKMHNSRREKLIMAKNFPI